MSTPEEYNTKTMEEFGWSRWHLSLPETATIFDVTEAVRDFQKSCGVTVDGRVGPVTWRRLETHGEHLRAGDVRGFLLVGGSLVTVPFATNNPAICKEYSLIGGGHSTRTANPTQVVWHWDAALSAKSCHRILKKKNISSHGAIDNDGVFYQFLDFADHVGWHAGHKKVNKASIGIDISNAVYTKYQSYYSNRWGPRPVIEARVHGRKHKLLGYYPAQVRTAIQIARVVNEQFGIPFNTPDEATTIDRPEDFAGHIAHYHVSKKKWDVAGFPFSEVMEEAANG